MKAIVTTPGTKGSVRLGEISEPSGTGMVQGADGKPGAAVEVEVVEVGVCGTDLEIANDGYGAPPAGRDSLVLGHENLGRVCQRPRRQSTCRRGSWWWPPSGGPVRSAVHRAPPARVTTA